MASPTVVQSVAKTTTSTVSSLQLTGLSTTAGNLYLISVAERSAGASISSVTDSASNTWAKQIATSGGVAAGSEIWTTTAEKPSAITSVTINLSAAINVAFRFFEISGADNSNPNIASAKNHASNTAISSGATAAPWPASSLAVASSASAQSTQDYTAAQAFTAGTPTVLPTTTTADFSNVVGSEIMLQSAYLALNTTAAQTYTETLSTSHGWSVAVLIIPAAVSPHVVQTVGSTNTASQTTRTLSGLTTTAGNLYLLTIGVSAGSPVVSSVTDSAGNSWAKQVQVNQASNADSEIWTTTGSFPAAITSVTVNLSGAGSRFVFRFWEIAGALNAGPLGASSGSTGTTTSAVTTGATGTPPPGSLAIATVDAQLANSPLFSSGQTFTSAAPASSEIFPTSLTSEISDGGAGAQADMESAYLMNVTVAQTFTVTITGTCNWAATIICIPPAQGDPGRAGGISHPWRGPFVFSPIVPAPVFAAPPGSVASNSYTVSISESLTAASDSVARVYVGARSISESLTAASDSLTRAYTGARTISESVSASDTVSRAFTGTRTVSESISASDSIARVYTGSRSISESVGASSDTVARVFSGARTISEALTAASDSVNRTYTGARTVSESISTSDSVARAYIGARSISESVSASDAVARAYTGSRSISESVGAASDSVARVVAWVRAASESVGTSSDVVTRVYTGNRAVNEALTAASDAISRAYTGSRAISESTSASDSVARAYTGARSISESVGPASDSAATGHQNFITVSETVGAAADVVTRVFTGSRSITESATASDAVARIYVGARAIAESVAASDAASRSFTGSRTVVENVSASDAVSRMFNPARSVAEAVGPATDANTVSRGFSRVIVETVGPATDSITRHVVLSRLIAEVVGPASDMVVPLAQQPRSSIVIPMLFRDGTVAFIFRDGSMALIFKS